MSGWPELPKRLHHSLRILCCLAQCSGPRRARELAECAGVSPAETAKLLYLLAWGGLVASRRGSKGGFWLRRPAERIRVREVMALFRRPPAVENGEEEDAVAQLWRQAIGPSQESFEGHTLAELVRLGEQGGVSSCGRDSSVAESDNKAAPAVPAWKGER